MLSAFFLFFGKMFISLEKKGGGGARRDIIHIINFIFKIIQGNVVVIKRVIKNCMY